MFSTQVVCCPLRPLRSIFSFVFPLKLVLFKDLVGSTFLMQIKLDVGQTYCITRSCQGALVYEIEIWTFFTLTLLYVYVAHSYSLVQRHSFKPQSLCAFAYFTQREFWRWSKKVKLLLFCMARTKTRRLNFGLKMSGLKFYLTLCPGIWSCFFLKLLFCRAGLWQSFEEP